MKTMRESVFMYQITLYSEGFIADLCDADRDVIDAAGAVKEEGKQ